MKRLILKTIDYILFIFFKENKLSRNDIDSELRKKYVYLEAWLSIICNLILAGIMVFFALLLNSIALLANAAHTASDVVSSVVVLLGFKFSSLPADNKHPYGHGRIEFLATLIISALLIVVGIEFGINAYHRYLANSMVQGSYLVIVIMIFASLFKEWMAEFSAELGRRANAIVLIADAWHHKTDGIAMMVVAIAILSSKYGYYRIDSVFGVGISILIIYTGTNILRDSISKLIGEAPEEDILEDIKNSVRLIPEVVSVHKIKIHNYGSYKEITLHIQLENSLSLVKAHSISEKVERKIESKIHCKAIVHAEPFSDLSHS
jgi:cation diffusion facilitator family transporter